MRARLTLTACLAIVAVLGVREAAGQQLEGGARIRGQTASERFDGRVLWSSAESLAVARHSDTLVYSKADIRQLDVATGSRRNVLQGLGIGAGIGAAGAAALLLAYDDDGDTGYLEGLEYLGAGAILLGSTAIGGITGAFIKSPRWTRVRPSGLGVSISF